MQQHHGKAFPKGEKGEEASVYKLGGGDVHKLTMSVNEKLLAWSSTVQRSIFCKKPNLAKKGKSRLCLSV